MEIIFSRHAQRRIKLYKIDAEDVQAVVENFLLKHAENMQYEVVDANYTSKYKYPLKVVFIKENDLITIVTSYPLKKGKEQ